MVRRSQPDRSLLPCWSEYPGFSVPREACLTRRELFAIDLLHIELRLKKCDREESVDTDFDGDANVVSIMIPHLLSTMSNLDEEIVDSVCNDDLVWISLKIRCYWLAAAFFFWRGRLCHNISESREAENEGLKYIEETIKCLSLPESHPIRALSIPHLESPGRTGLHWKELSMTTLTAFRDEIQASSIILLAREQFLEVTSIIRGTDEDGDLESSMDRDTLFATGEALLERYKSPIGSEKAKHFELIHDFLEVHGRELLYRNSEDEDDRNTMEMLEKIVPSGSITVGYLLGLENPCILTILLACLQSKPDKMFEVARLLARLVITIGYLHQNILDDNQTRRQAEFGIPMDVFDESDDSSQSSKSTDGSASGKAGGSVNRTKLIQYAQLMRLLLERIRRVVCDDLSSDEQSQFLKDDDCYRVLHISLSFSATWFNCHGHRTGEGCEDMEDRGVLISIQKLFRSFSRISSSKVSLGLLTRVYLMGSVRIISQQRETLSQLFQSPCHRQDRASRQRTMRSRAELLAAVCCDIGLLLSTNLVHVKAGVMTRSELFKEEGFNVESNEPLLPVLCDSLLWLWCIASGVDQSKTSRNQSIVSLDQFSKECLRIPVAAAIVGLCGSAATTIRCTGNLDRESASLQNSTAQICLTEFFDSDASAMEWLSDDGDEASPGGRRHEGLLRVISQAVHCINHVTGVIDETSQCTEHITQHGPLLPLVVVRVLNKLADCLLADFLPESIHEAEDVDDDEREWFEFPFGTRSTGALLDFIIHKSYYCLHGFTLVGDGKDCAGNATENRKAKTFLPENENAAAMLYGCIMRAYSRGRKSPPKGSLETVLAVLPRNEETKRSKAICNYLFSTNKDFFQLKDLLLLMSKGSNWDANFLDLRSYVSKRTEDSKENTLKDKSLMVRRGISELIAHGPLPVHQDSSGDQDKRAPTCQTEKELSKKFDALVDGLCYGDMTDCKSWYKAAQCLVTKADLIADRLGLSKGLARNKNFFVPKHQKQAENSLEIGELLSVQEKGAQLKKEGSVRVLGQNLLLFSKHSWSSFESLQACSNEIRSSYNFPARRQSDEDQIEVFETRLLQEIDTYFSKKKFAAWQESWGGLFVSSLRIVAIRCMCFALFILYERGDEYGSAERAMFSEITEALAVELYSELTASQEYGFPMHTMTPYRKRALAETSLAFFERVIEIEKVPEGRGGENPRVTWDLLFMVGKVSPA